MPTKSPKEHELKGLEGSNPVRSSSQSGFCAALETRGKFPRSRAPVIAKFCGRRSLPVVIINPRWHFWLRRFSS
jgi:hypothetical protein